jgi:hypothetical protein
LKAYVVLTIANESNGNLTMARIDKCSINKQDISNFFKAGPKSWKETMKTERGEGEFLCEKNIHEIIIEGVEENGK